MTTTRLFHPGNQDRAASRVRPGGGQGGVRRLLGVSPQTDESYDIGFEAAGQHIGLVPGGVPPGMTSPVAYWHVPDLEAKLAEVTAAGATLKDPRATSVAAARGHRHRPRWQCPRAASGLMSANSRSRAQRRRDTEHRLTNDIDVWVASASADGAPYLVPLCFDWDGEALLVATPTDSPTGRNPAVTRAVGLGLGHTLMRDGRCGSDASAGRAAWLGPRGSTGRSNGEPEVLLEAGQIEPGDADGDREGGPAQQMETR